MNAEETKEVLLEMRRRSAAESASEFFRRTGLDEGIYLRAARATGGDAAAVARDIHSGFILAEILRNR